MVDDCVVYETTVDHPRAELWAVLGEPARYPRFFRGISGCDKLAPAYYGAQPEYAMRACLGPGEVLDHRLRTVIRRTDDQLVLAGVPDTGGWVSIKLQDAERGRTQIKVVFFKPMLRHRLGVSWSEAQIKRWARDGIRRVCDHLAGAPDRLPERDGGKGGRLGALRVLAAAGVFSPTRPDRTARQLRALAKWGSTVAGGYGAAAARSAKRAAVIDERGVSTFRDIDIGSTQLAHGLTELGVQARTKVAVLARNHAALVRTLAACAKLGADTVLLNTGLAGAQVVDLLRTHRVTVLVADDEFAPLLHDIPPEVTLIGSGAVADVEFDATLAALAADQPADPLPAPRRPGRLVVLTSGTSGTPKGARRPTPGLLDAAMVLAGIPLRANERIFVAAPIFHSWGLTALQIGMPLRATMVLRRRFDAEATLAAIEEHGCTALFAVPIMLQRILALPERVRDRYDTSSLRIVASSGSALPRSLVTGFMDAFGDVLYNFYGSTEVSAATIASPHDLRAAPTTAGKPPPGARIALLDRDGAQVPPGEVGRIFVGNDMLFDGYLDGAEREVRRGLMDTGDRGYLDADGRLHICGRDDEMIVSGGENVFPRPVEEVLTDLPQVVEAAVVGVPDAEYGQRLAAYIVVRDGWRLDEDSVRAYVHQRLARFSVPRDVVFVDELPRNQTGKVLKRVLADGDVAEPAALPNVG
ncbi:MULTISPECIES: AMP-binding protein [Actinokineospora]|uniref:Fatty-acyl-CoA synthase n=1 Tax=Actinokineospora fastidiosa TaxID=1816 RepID=A0A918GMU3_9PSEU|nr:MULTISPECIES: AMP-binding protein [Actinokineospora]UVS78908.1 Long-chain-fatty-acid--CoA ligase [Actinokineospora sp. UTMC 2448]GGS48091.1 fatty-acyl-CoA synthase [Actinokineospora fastidiosa]